MAWFCRHDWVVDTTVLPSGIEQLAAAGQGFESATGGQLRILAQKAVVTILTCRRCGKAKRIVTRNPI